MEKYLTNRVNELKLKHPSIGDFRCTGLLSCIELVKNRETKEPLVPWNASPSEMGVMPQIISKLRDLGLIVFIRWNLIFIAPPLIITESQLDEGLEKILFKKIFIFKELKRIKRIFESTFFPVKPENVEDDLEKIILDADILSSLMFGPQVGVKLASRLKQEIRYNDDSELLFSNFLKLLGGKCLYLDYSKKSC